jgi:prepilin-type processing-associated H-X9-DG protein
MANYIIIGGDGKEYGPVSGEQLRQWIADGRAHAGTQVRTEGATGWQPLSAVPDLAAGLKSAATTLSPAAVTAVTAVTKKTSALAVTSLVLGILGMFSCGITALAGLICGIVAMIKVKNSGGRLGGGGLALAGTIVSGIFLLLIPVLAAMMLPALAAAHDKAREINCMNNEKQLAMAVIIYSNDHTNHFPPAATWCDAIKASAGSEQVFRCTAANSTNRCDYAFNAKLDGFDESKINPQNAQTVMIFESDGGWNANGGPELLPAKARHLRKFYVVAFVDGHVEAVNQSRLNTLRWDP